MHTRVVGIKGENIADTHIDQFFQSEGTVKRLSLCALMLAAFIEEWHDHIDAVRLSGSCGNDTFQILIMVIPGTCDLNVR